MKFLPRNSSTFYLNFKQTKRFLYIIKFQKKSNLIVGIEINHNIIIKRSLTKVPQKLMTCKSNKLQVKYLKSGHGEACYAFAAR